MTNADEAMKYTIGGMSQASIEKKIAQYEKEFGFSSAEFQKRRLKLLDCFAVREWTVLLGLRVRDDDSGR